MKKFENFLLITVLILLFYSASKYSDTSIDIHYHDTYYLISGAAIGGWFALWLLIVFLLLKIIRRRHHFVHPIFTLIYGVLTLVFLGVIFALTRVGGPSNRAGYSAADLDALIFRNQMSMLAVWCLLALQVIFMIYFIVQLLKKPALQR
jgi:hypothetical protein